MLQRLKHPNCVQLHEALQSTTEVYFVMELAGQCTLTDAIRQGPMGRCSEFQAIEVVTQVLQFLEYLHRQGIAHRDLKPDNIMVTYRAHMQVKVCSLIYHFCKPVAASFFL